MREQSRVGVNIAQAKGVTARVLPSEYREREAARRMCCEHALHCFTRFTQRLTIHHLSSEEDLEVDFEDGTRFRC